MKYIFIYKYNKYHISKHNRETQKKMMVPDEIVAEILSFLTANNSDIVLIYSLVNKRWMNIVINYIKLPLNCKYTQSKKAIESSYRKCFNNIKITDKLKTKSNSKLATIKLT